MQVLMKKFWWEPKSLQPKLFIANIQPIIASYEAIEAEAFVNGPEVRKVSS